MIFICLLESITMLHSHRWPYRCSLNAMTVLITRWDAMYYTPFSDVDSYNSPVEYQQGKCYFHTSFIICLAAEVVERKSESKRVCGKAFQP